MIKSYYYKLCGCPVKVVLDTLLENKQLGHTSSHLAWPNLSTIKFSWLWSSHITRLQVLKTPLKQHQPDQTMRPANTFKPVQKKL